MAITSRFRDLPVNPILYPCRLLKDPITAVCPNRGASSSASLTQTKYHLYNMQMIKCFIFHGTEHLRKKENINKSLLRDKHKYLFNVSITELSMLLALVYCLNSCLLIYCKPGTSLHLWSQHEWQLFGPAGPRGGTRCSIWCLLVWGQQGKEHCLCISTSPPVLRASTAGWELDASNKACSTA